MFHSLDTETIPWRASTFAPNVWVKDMGIADGYSLQLVKFEAGASFPPHQHQKAEFIYILEGELMQHGHLLSKGFVSISAPLSMDDVVYSPKGCTFILMAAA